MRCRIQVSDPQRHQSQGRLKTFQTALALLCTFIPIQKSKPTRRQAADSTDIVKCKKKLHKTTFCNDVGWVDKPNVSDGLWICWAYNPTYLPYHFFVHSTIYTSPLGLFLARYLAFKTNVDMICHQSLMAKQVVSHHRLANVPLAILAPALNTADSKLLSEGMGTDCRLFGRLDCRPDSRTRHLPRP